MSATSGIVLEVAAADTEYSFALPAGTNYLAMKNLTGQALRFAFKTGTVAAPTGNYYALGVFEDRPLGELNTSGVTLFYASGLAGARFEVRISTAL